MKTSLKILIGIVAVVALAVIGVALFISPVAKKYIEEHDHELIGRSIRMDNLRMNIFTGRLRMEGLNVGGVDDSTTFFRVDSFDMRLKLLPLIKNRIDVPYVTFVGPDVKVYQRGIEFNFDGLLNRFMSDSTQIEETPSEPWNIAINNIVIRSGHLFYKDVELNAVWGLNNIDLTIPGVHFSGEKTDVGAVLNFAEGGSLATQVAYDMEKSAFDIGIKLQNLTLPGTLPYFQQTLNVTAVEGLLSADMNLHGDLEHLLSVRTEGTAALSGFKLYDMQNRPVIGIDTLAMNLAEGDLGQMKFRFDRLYVGGFSTFAELTDTGNNLMELMKPDTQAETTAQATEQEQAATPELSFSVADMEIANSRLTIRDMTLQKPFEYQISNIRMRSKEFNPSAKNNLVIDAQMQKTGHAKLLWDGSLDDINNQSITLLLTNVALHDFTPYCEHYTAYPLTQGNLSFHSQNVIRNRYLDGTNHLDVFEPQVDKKRKELNPEMNIPLKLGLYVLKDKKGHVKMDLPVKGSLDSPEFSYRKIVLKAIGNVLLKVATAPFSFLGGSKDNLEYINIDACQYAFSSEQYAFFDRVAQMIQEKPEIHIALTQRINFEQAVPRQASDVLRMAYAKHLRAADSLAKQPQQMTMLEFEKIQQIDIRTPEVVAFADSLLLQNGMTSRGSTADKAAVLYGTEAAQQLRRMMTARNKSLADYMQRTYNIATPAFRIQHMDSVALQSYKGRDRYTIALELDGETLEIAPADSTAMTHTLPQAAATALRE